MPAESIDALSARVRELENGLRLLQHELDEKNAALIAAGNLASRALAGYRHDLRTPINSILGLSRLLLSQGDGPLNEEQNKQVGFILRAGETLSQLVNDLLDATRVEPAGAPLRLTKFQAADVLGAASGMVRGLPVAPGVQLVFEEPQGIPELEQDEAKIAQILRNLVSNALKFTERGTVRVTVEPTDFGAVHFNVVDTGIGIERKVLGRIFEEFGPVDLQRAGTGLGLAASKRLAATLSGDVSVQSQPGKGSRFTLTVPLVHPDAVEMRLLEDRVRKADPARPKVLVVEDDRATLLLYEKYLARANLQIVPARSIADARQKLTAVRPAAIMLDVVLEDESSWSMLSGLKTNPATRDIPVMVVTVIGGEQRARSLGADEFALKPVDEKWLQTRLATMSKRGPLRRVLVIDDDESSRYLVRKHLTGTGYAATEAADAASGMAAARAQRPDLILLDFFLPDATALDVVDELRHDDRTRDVPIIVMSAHQLSAHDRERLHAATSAVVSKAQLSREEALARIGEALASAQR